MYSVIASIYIQCCIWSVAHTQDPAVDTNYGRVSGETVVLADGSVIDTYMGIPFAKPPVGELRFARPLEPDPWDGIFPATGLGSACLQPLVTGVHVTHRGWEDFSEDCLHLNIYTAQRNGSDLFPVMVYIHGGDFQTGANFVYTGYFLAQKEVVVVTVNYRLGIMGFAFSGDGVIRGNNGLADQILALTFVQENIEAFGGDPNRVTIFGESAGGASVGFLLMSPQATGLFHGAILQSGTELAPWMFFLPEMEPENYIYQVAESVNCPVSPGNDMLSCLREKDGMSVVLRRINCTDGYICSGGFRPVVDGDILPDTPDSIRASGEYNKVPEMIGINENEASIFVVSYPFVGPHGVNRTDFDAYIETVVAAVSASWPDASRTEEDVIEAFRFFYAEWPYFENMKSNRDMMVKLETDWGFGYSADRQAKSHSEAGADGFYYIYDYVPEYSERQKWMGAYHGIELSMEFGWPFFEGNEQAYNHSQTTRYTNYSSADAEFSHFMMTMWTNFAKYSNPTEDPVLAPDDTPITWDRFMAENLTNLNFRYQPMQDKDYRQKEYAFWTEYLQYLTDGIPFADFSAEQINQYQDEETV